MLKYYITGAQLCSWTLCWRSWYLILTAETFQANLSSVVAQAQEQRDPRKWGGGHIFYPQNWISGYLQSSRNTVFYSVLFLATGSNNICTHLGKPPKTADGCAAQEGLRSCQEEPKCRTGAEVTMACCLWQLSATLQRQRVSEQEGIKGCRGSCLPGEVQQSPLLGFQGPPVPGQAAQPLAEHILGWAVASFDWWQSLIKPSTHLSFIQEKQNKKGRGQGESLCCSADSTDNISSFVGHFSSPVWWEINL